MPKGVVLSSNKPMTRPAHEGLHAIWEIFPRGDYLPMLWDCEVGGQRVQS